MANRVWKQQFHLNTWATFSKKYQNVRCSDLFDKDPEYLVWCIDNLKLPLAEDLRTKIEEYKKNKERRGITKVSYFK